MFRRGPVGIFAIFLVGIAPALVQGKQNVSVLLFYECPHSVKSFDAAVDYVRNNPVFEINIGEVHKIRSNGTDATKLITNLCRSVDYIFSGPQNPDIVVDFTRHGIPSEAVKMITKVMNLPTISGSFGQEGDVRSWRDLSENMTNYLIQIAPPADLVPQAMRSLVSQQNMKNAVLLFNEEYEMYHKHKALLQGMPTRHLLRELGNTTCSIRTQLERLQMANLTNIFVAGTPSEISSVVAEATDPKIVDFGDELALYSMSMESGLPEYTGCGCKENVSLIHLHPIFSHEANKRQDFLEWKKIFESQHLMEYFYFDLAVDAILTVAKMKKDATWKTPPKRKCEDTDKFNDDFELDLFSNFKADEIQRNNVLGPFFIDSDRKLGGSFAYFKMNISRLIFKEGHKEPETNVNLGTWLAGFGEREYIVTQGVNEQWKAHG